MDIFDQADNAAQVQNNKAPVKKQEPSGKIPTGNNVILAKAWAKFPGNLPKMEYKSIRNNKFLDQMIFKIADHRRVEIPDNAVLVSVIGPETEKGYSYLYFEVPAN